MRALATGARAYLLESATDEDLRPAVRAVAAGKNCMTEDAIVAVQSEWNGWRTAMVRVGNLEDVHWAQPSGAPKPLIHAVVSCDRIRSGEIDHRCELTRPPHHLLVCVLKCHTAASVYEELSRRAAAVAPLRI
jgi:hypothetical protein